MSMSESKSLKRPVSDAVMDALSFQAPYVVERLVKNRIADSASEGERLFTEAKRYLVLCETHSDVHVGMYSVRVDEAWHAFLLYTNQYTQFCKRYFGRYIAHAPTNAPPVEARDQERRAELTFPEFRERYEALFGEPLPDVWYNARGISPARRVFNDSAERMTVLHHHSVAELLDDKDDVIVSVNDIAHDALEFIARTSAFYVRELPGGLTGKEKVALVEALVSAGALRVAP
jgi:hypothetical protein